MGIIKKAAIVTGGAGGIGSAVCRALAAEGYPVAVCFNTSKVEAAALCEEITAAKGTAAAFKCDIGDIESIKACVASVRAKYGDIGLLVNNAGTANIGLYTDLSDEQLTRLMNVNLLGAMRISKEVIPDMVRSHSGNIINISSVWGECGASCEVAYSAAKAGLIGFTKALAKELAPSGVRVNCISCGLIDTKMNSELSADDISALLQDIPTGRMGTTEDVANALLFLAGEGSAYITGQTIRVDGAWL